MTDHPPLIAVTDEELEDLRARLRATRWLTRWPVDGWEAGADTTEVRRLAEYWATGYDWRAHEARINALPHHTAVIGGTPVHYLRFDGERPGALPIVLSHGWPSTFLKKVEVPTAVAVFPADLTRPPRSWAERTYNIARYTSMPRGGHFAAHEEPGLLADDITEFFRQLR